MCGPGLQCAESADQLDLHSCQARSSAGQLAAAQPMLTSTRAARATSHGAVLGSLSGVLLLVLLWLGGEVTELFSARHAAMPQQIARASTHAAAQNCGGAHALYAHGFGSSTYQKATGGGLAGLQAAHGPVVGDIVTANRAAVYSLLDCLFKLAREIESCAKLFGSPQLCKFVLRCVGA